MELRPLARPLLFMLIVAVAAFLLLGYTWAGYPALMALLARRGRRAVPTAPAGQERAGSVAVVIASRDTPSAIAARIDNIRTVPWPLAEGQIVVALDVGALPGGRDGAEARQYQAAVEAAVAGRAVVVRGDEEGGKGSALNAAFRALDVELVVLADTHQRFAPETIPWLVAALDADPTLGAVSGELSTRAPGDAPGLADRYWEVERVLRAHEAVVHSTVGVTGAVYAVRRRSYPTLPSALILDDLYVPMRIVLGGQRIGFERRAGALDTRRFSLDQEYRRKVRTLTGVWQLCAWLPGVLAPWRNPIWVQFLSHKLLRLLTPYLVVIGGVAMLAAVGPWVLDRAPWIPPALGAVGLLALIAPGIGRRVRNLLHSLLVMQAAIVVATMNGVRGRWAVWR